MPDKTFSVAANVRAELARAGISQRQLADELQIDRGQMHRRVSGEVQFRADELTAIADHLGIPVARFYASPDTAGAAS